MSFAVARRLPLHGRVLGVCQRRVAQQQQQQHANVPTVSTRQLWLGGRRASIDGTGSSCCCNGVAGQPQRVGAGRVLSLAAAAGAAVALLSTSAVHGGAEAEEKKQIRLSIEPSVETDLACKYVLSACV